MLHYTLRVFAPVPALLLLGNYSNSLLMYAWFYFTPLCIEKMWKNDLKDLSYYKYKKKYKKKKTY